MKTLHFIRHGKSSWNLPGLADIDRPLLDKGVQNNYQMAERLRNMFEKPSLIISSHAVRAVHTAIIFAKTIGANINAIQLNSRIYESDTSTLFDIIEGIPNNVDNLMIVGHNPTFTDLANHYLEPKIDNLPTSGIVTLQFKTSTWHIKNEKPVLSQVNYPKNN